MIATDRDITAVPTSIHRAIDQVTILKIELHQLRLLLLAGEVIDPARLAIMETALDDVATVLLHCRDQADRSGS
jgi:hypothetical protein